MTVSVVIPTYNRPKKLVQCVESVLQQQRTPEEILVIDDASSRSYDASIERLRRETRELEASVDFTYVRLNEGGGGSYARNQGAQRTKGDVIMFLDDDDTWQPDKIARQHAKLEANADVGLVYSGRRVVNEEGNLLYCIDANQSGDIFIDLLQGNCIGTTSSVAIRAEHFRRVDGFDEALPAMQDYELWIRIARQTRVAYDSAHTVNWTVHTTASNQMAGDPSIYKEAYRRITEKHSEAFHKLTQSERRRSRATHYASIADKCARAGELRQQYQYALRSLRTYPMLAGLSRLLPYRVWLQLRKIVSQCE